MGETLATTSEHHQRSEDLTSAVEYLSHEDALDLLDRQARKFLNLSGPEFVQAYRDGTLEDPHSLAVLRVAVLLPLADD